MRTLVAVVGLYGLLASACGSAETADERRELALSSIVVDYPGGAQRLIEFSYEHERLQKVEVSSTRRGVETRHQVRYDSAGRVSIIELMQFDEFLGPTNPDASTFKYSDDGLLIEILSRFGPRIFRYGDQRKIKAIQYLKPSGLLDEDWAFVRDNDGPVTAYSITRFWNLVDTPNETTPLAENATYLFESSGQVSSIDLQDRSNGVDTERAGTAYLRHDEAGRLTEVFVDVGLRWNMTAPVEFQVRYNVSPRPIT